jgi:hypothetical protein
MRNRIYRSINTVISCSNVRVRTAYSSYKSFNDKSTVWSVLLNRFLL